MQVLGFNRVYNLVGGISAWEAKNYPIIKSKDIKKLSKPIFKSSDFDNILNTNEIVLVSFTTQWCVPCKKMKVITDEIKKENSNIKVLYIDADANKELMSMWDITGVPTFIVFKNSKNVFRQLGLISKKELLDISQNHNIAFITDIYDRIWIYKLNEGAAQYTYPNYIKDCYGLDTEKYYSDFIDSLSSAMASLPWNVGPVWWKRKDNFYDPPRVELQSYEKDRLIKLNIFPTTKEEYEELYELYIDKMAVDEQPRRGLIFEESQNSDKKRVNYHKKFYFVLVMYEVAWVVDHAKESYRKAAEGDKEFYKKMKAKNAFQIIDFEMDKIDANSSM